MLFVLLNGLTYLAKKDLLFVVLKTNARNPPAAHLLTFIYGIACFRCSRSHPHVEEFCEHAHEEVRTLMPFRSPPCRSPIPRVVLS